MNSKGLVGLEKVLKEERKCYTDEKLLRFARAFLFLAMLLQCPKGNLYKKEMCNLDVRHSYASFFIRHCCHKEAAGSKGIWNRFP